MGAAITLAGESLIAQKQAEQKPLDVARFVFANVPGLSANTPVDRAAGKPPAAQIVHTAAIPPSAKGYASPNQVVYSVMLGSDVGDWDFNWIGLETAENVLFAVSYVPTQQKRKNIPPGQIGNNLTRNFLVEFDGAQALTEITIDASTWQHDFTVRLGSMDERERLSNRDIFGRACFFGSAFQLEKVSGAFRLKAGTAYVEGIRINSAATTAVVPTVFPTTAFLDVALVRDANDVAARFSVAFAAQKADYVDSAGRQHFCIPIAQLASSTAFTDLRPTEPIDKALVEIFAHRTGDYPALRARGTTKEDVGLDQLPNAKSDDQTSNSSEVLATTKQVKNAIAALLAATLDNDPNFATTIANALAAKAPLASPALTGSPTAPTQAAGNNSTRIATTAFVTAVQTALTTLINAKAPLASPALTGTPTAPTAAVSANTTQIATTAFVKAVVAQLVDSSPAALDTLSELAAALGNDPNFATTMVNALAAKAPLASPALTGNPTAPTQPAGNNSTRLANTAFVAAVQTALTTLINAKAPLASPALTGNPTAPTQAAGNNSTRLATTAFVSTAIAGGSLGLEQDYQVLTTSRAAATNYTNTLSRSIEVKISITRMAIGLASLLVNGKNIQQAPNNGECLSAVVPPGATYRLNLAAGLTLLNWSELR